MEKDEGNENKRINYGIGKTDLHTLFERLEEASNCPEDRKKTRILAEIQKEANNRRETANIWLIYMKKAFDAFSFEFIENNVLDVKANAEVHKRATALGTLVKCWGSSIVQHYGWAIRPTKIIDLLRQAARKHNWEVTRCLLNCIILEDADWSNAIMIRQNRIEKLIKYGKVLTRNGDSQSVVRELTKVVDRFVEDENLSPDEYDLLDVSRSTIRDVSRVVEARKLIRGALRGQQNDANRDSTRTTFHSPSTNNQRWNGQWQTGHSVEVFGSIEDPDSRTTNLPRPVSTNNRRQRASRVGAYRESSITEGFIPESEDSESQSMREEQQYVDEFLPGIESMASDGEGEGEGPRTISESYNRPISDDEDSSSQGLAMDESEDNSPDQEAEKTSTRKDLPLDTDELDRLARANERLKLELEKQQQEFRTKQDEWVTDLKEIQIKLDAEIANGHMCTAINTNLSRKGQDQAIQIVHLQQNLDQKDVQVTELQKTLNSLSSILEAFKEGCRSAQKHAKQSLLRLSRVREEAERYVTHDVSQNPDMAGKIADLESKLLTYKEQQKAIEEQHQAQLVEKDMFMNAHVDKLLRSEATVNRLKKELKHYELACPLALKQINVSHSAISDIKTVIQGTNGARSSREVRQANLQTALKPTVLRSDRVDRDGMPYPPEEHPIPVDVVSEGPGDFAFAATKPAYSVS